jgi:hypothetical protein
MKDDFGYFERLASASTPIVVEITYSNCSYITRVTVPPSRAINVSVGWCYAQLHLGASSPVTLLGRGNLDHSGTPGRFWAGIRCQRTR